MHIPDGFLDAKVWTTMSVVTGGTAGYAIKQVNKKLGERQIPLMGVMGAFIFAAQMINFPVAGGTSGHLLGSALAAILLGPWSAILVTTANFIIQCLLFQDGGLTALGANVFNMGILGCLVGYAIYQGIRKMVGGDKGIIIGAGVAAWCSVMLAATGTSLALAFSGTVPLNVVIVPMLAIHALVGIGEAVITVAAVQYILKVRPDIIYDVPKV